MHSSCETKFHFINSVVSVGDCVCVVTRNVFDFPKTMKCETKFHFLYNFQFIIKFVDVFSPLMKIFIFRSNCSIDSGECTNVFNKQFHFILISISKYSVICLLNFNGSMNSVLFLLQWPSWLHFSSAGLHFIPKEYLICICTGPYRMNSTCSWFTFPVFCITSQHASIHCCTTS